MTLLHLVQDQHEKPGIRGAAAQTLGDVGGGQAEVLTTLLRLVRNRREELTVRQGAIQALGQVSQGQGEVVKTLLKVAQDTALRDVALGALWDALAGGE